MKVQVNLFNAGKIAHLARKLKKLPGASNTINSTLTQQKSGSGYEFDENS